VHNTLDLSNSLFSVQINLAVSHLTIISLNLPSKTQTWLLNALSKWELIISLFDDHKNVYEDEYESLCKINI
jgi:hypothetical protein